MFADETFCFIKPSSLWSKLTDMDANAFVYMADEYFSLKRYSEDTVLRKYRAHFGITPKVTAILWGLIQENLRNFFQPKHLLWGLFFLKNYWTENTNVSLWKCDEKTYRKWTWHVIYIISDLPIVSLFLFLSDIALIPLILQDDFWQNFR